MIVLLTIKDLNVPYEYILDKPLEIKYFNVDSDAIFTADFVVFMYIDYNYVLKNRVDGITGMIAHSEANWYITKLIRAR